MVEDIYGQLQQAVAIGRIDIGGLEDGIAHKTDATVGTRKSVDSTEEGEFSLASLFR
jgi:hypothetical protein